LLTNTTGQVRVLQVETASPSLKFSERTLLLVTTDGNLPWHSVV
jgi:hypothetical protein